MKQFKESCRLHSLNEQIFAHIFLFGFLIIVGLIQYGGSASSSPVVILTVIGTMSVGFLMLISSNRITYIDDRNSTLEIRWFFAYRFCYRRKRISLKDINQLTLVTIIDFEGDKTYELNIEVLAKDQGLFKPTPDKIKIIFSQSLDPILKSGERLSKLYRTKLVRAQHR